MAFSNTTSYAGPYTGNGATTVFAFSFFAQTASDVAVLLDGSVASTSLYSVSVTPGGGGSVTFATAPASGVEVIPILSPPYAQDREFTDGAAFSASSIEDAVDDLAKHAVHLKGLSERSPRFPVGVARRDYADGLTVGEVLYITSGGKIGSVENSVTGAEASATAAAAAQAAVELIAPVSVFDYGAVGDGATDDTAALQAALDTGDDVYLPEGYAFLFTSDLTFAADHQALFGSGVLKPVGNCGVLVNGGLVGVRLDLIFNSSTHTGTAITVNNADRTTIRMLGIEVNNAIYVTKANTTTIEYAWAICNGHGIHWYGDANNRSDILNIFNATFDVSASSSNYGLIWDGNCHSLRIYSLGIVCGSGESASNGRGMIIRNTAGSTAPAISRIFGLEIDYSGSNGIEIADSLVTSDHEFHGSYVLGAQGSGILIGDSVNTDEVRIIGGKFRGGTRYGIENTSSGRILYDGMADLADNDLGTIDGDAVVAPNQIAFSATQSIALDGSGDVVIAGDTDDYVSYDKSANAWRYFIGATEVFEFDASRINAKVPVQLPTYTFAQLSALTPSAGWKAVCSDSNTATFNATIAGGGANIVEALYNGTNWVVS